MIPKHLLIKFDELKVGQKVWSSRHGYVAITGIVIPSPFPIRVQTEDNKDAWEVIGNLFENPELLNQ